MFLVLLRPFNVGDMVSVAGIIGAVETIGLFGTTISTPDNVQTIVGNNNIFSDTIQSVSAILSARRSDGHHQQRSIIGRPSGC